MNSAITPRLELVTCVLFAAALLLTLQLHLLPSLLAGLLVYALVHMLVPLLRLPVFGHESARLVAVTLIATVVITRGACRSISGPKRRKSAGVNWISAPAASSARSSGP